MRPDYKKWLEEQKYASGTISAQLHRVGRVEECYGDLEKLWHNRQLNDVFAELAYSTDDERGNKPNPSKIPFQGKVRTNLASYKDALKRYQNFLSGGEPLGAAEVSSISASVPEATNPQIVATDLILQKLSLERDMQAALRQNINQLGYTLTISDDGAERSVESGFIDILCEDSADGSLVVIELKAGKTDGRVIGQILGYMGDLSQEEPERKIKGVIVAQDFDKRTLSASRAVSNLVLKRYSVEFSFHVVE